MARRAIIQRRRASEAMSIGPTSALATTSRALRRSIEVITTQSKEISAVPRSRARYLLDVNYIHPTDFDRRQTRERAGILTKAAVDAARTGDCATVAKLDVEVREIDADFHDTVFVRDVGIGECQDSC